MKRFLKYTFITLVLLIGSAALYIYMLEKVKIKVQPNQDDTFYDPDTTTFILPVSLALKDIENLANLKLNNKLFDGALPVRKAKDTLHLKIDRSGNIRFSIRNNLLVAFIPLDAEAYYTLHTIGKKTRTFFKDSPVKFSLDAVLETPVVLNSLYGFTPKTHLRSIEWKKPPVIEAGPFKKDISEETEEALFKKEKQITAKLDSILSRKISLRKPLSVIWQKIQRPAPLKFGNSSFILYLRKEPLSASVWLAPAENDSLHFVLQLKSLVRILNARDTSRYEKKGLPPRITVTTIEPLDDTSRFHIQLAIPLFMIEHISNRKLAGKSLQYEGYKIKLRKIRVINGEKNIIISMKYRGDFKGELRLKGMPRLDVKKKTFNVDDLEYESRGEDNELVGSVDKVFHQDILNKIKESMRIDMEKMMDTIPFIIQRGINKSKLANKANLSLQGFEIKQVKTYLTSKYIHLMVRGNASVRMNLKKEAIIKSKKIPEVIE